MAEEELQSAAAKSVEEAAANVHKAAARITRPSRSTTEATVRAYFQKINERDLEGALEMWIPDGYENVRGQVNAITPASIREFVGGLLGAFPDLHFEIVNTTTEGDRCAMQWQLTGTLAGPGSLNGVAPTGDSILLEGIDLVRVRNGAIASIDAFTDTMTLPRQIGMMPPLGSTAEQRMMSAFNLKTRVARLPESDAKPIADGVWLVQGQPGRCNVYLLRDGTGVTVFDAGARTMTRAVASAGAKLGGIQRVVLGHGHTDHRGTAPALGVPVLCHPDEVQDAEGSGGFRYWPANLTGLPTPQRQIHRLLHRYAWDGGPVKISATVSEGDDVAGFSVVHLPGHAPGLIGLWRESDRLALVSDCFYTLDMWGRNCAPHLPDPTYNIDTEQARASMLKLAALEPATAWAGHAQPVTGDVRAQLERAAAAH
ncbi:MAG TPA: ester cyclase [Solirubrobacteraceae bacterium]|nr:ester cyclase [Solirubrobacteraceae bacterium]